MLDSLVGIPFKWGGLDKKGCDCLGLANLARVACGLAPVAGFDWVYDEYRCISELPEKTVEDELLKLGWGVVDGELKDMDVVLIQGSYALAIGTYYQGEVLYFPSVFSVLRNIDECGDSVVGAMRE
jgi:hypothetical protein